MKAAEKQKTLKTISRIENGEFDENDIDNLFMRLRAYSHGNAVFREIADFVAHNDRRTKGRTTDSLEAFYLSFRYFGEYVSPKRPLDIGAPFPLYIKKLMKYQALKVKEGDLKERFGFSRRRLLAKIDSTFSEDKKRGTASLKKGRLSQPTFQALQFLLSFIGSHPAYDQSAILSETMAVLHKNNLEFDQEKFLAQGDRLIVCILFLLHETEFEFGGPKPGYCRISCDKLSIAHNVRFIDDEGNPVEHSETFGNLQVQGHVVVAWNDSEITICYPLMVTDLDVEKWCDKSLFVVEPLSDQAPEYLCRKVQFDNLTINGEGKLSAAGA